MTYRDYMIGSNISIHAPREGGDPDRAHEPSGDHHISIHAPREGGDMVSRAQTVISSISIHAPREGGDWTTRISPSTSGTFQSTPPARGATSVISICSK